ncbi:hypothetical protein Q8A67_005146 [Cirrhinus molitorella]|uniref:Cadherin domain-containing protein n=1 Tax=Cirrhinus molitorella TaxID=172907 RepID=A0AA88Q264_9TELE|nr:hypothetical protein Q8A67_005146 [Cirrhinus molitorella]
MGLLGETEWGPEGEFLLESVVVLLVDPELEPVVGLMVGLVPGLVVVLVVGVEVELEVVSVAGVEVELEVEPVVEVEVELEVVSVAGVEVELEVEPVVEVEVELEVEPVVEVEVELEVVSVAGVEVELEVEPVVEVEVELEVVSVAGVEVELEVEPVVEVEVELEVEPVVEVEVEVEVVSVAGVEVELEVEPVVEVEVVSVAGVEVELEVEPVVEVEVEVEVVSVAGVEVELEVEPVVEVEVEVEVVSVAGVEVELEVEPVVELEVELEVVPVVVLVIDLEVEPLVGFMVGLPVGLEVSLVVVLVVAVEPLVGFVVGLCVSLVVESVVGFETGLTVETVVGLVLELNIGLKVEVDARGADSFNEVGVKARAFGLADNCLKKKKSICITQVNCATGTNTYVGSILEGYEGDVEIINNIEPDDRLVLEATSAANVLEFLELLYSDGDSTATIRTKKPLDAEELQESGGNLYYSVTCLNTGKKNTRTLEVLDINDNPPNFQSKIYSATVSDTTAVGTDVIRVRADDADVSPENNKITYSLLPPVPDEFEVRDDGNIRLTNDLNYNNAHQYILTMEARDKGGLSSTTTIIIVVQDVDNLNPYFDHSLYEAFIEENQVGQFSDITPAAIKAQDGDTGINEPVVYSITAVFPNEYQSIFEIDQNTGVISVRTALDREEVDQITVHIQAAQQDDASKTASTVVSITIEDVNDNLPKFDQDEYTVSILENSLPNQLVLQTRVTDLDLVIAVDQPVNGLSSTAHVNITVLDVNDNNPQFLPLPEPIEIQEGVYTPSSPGENITTVRVRITDINDNAPVFSSETYSRSILVKDAKVGEVLLTLSATDKDAGSNANISYSFSEVSSMVTLDAKTGNITLTSDLSEVTEDILLNLTAIATDHGTPAQSDEAEVLIHFKNASITESVAFENSYNFIIKENQPKATIVGKVKALTGSPLVTVSYNMKSHEDVFSVDGEGTIKALRPLDKEEEEWYILRVEAVDSRTPPNTADTMVSVQVENVNEAPVFDDEIYEKDIFSIVPYKFPIVKASDPDVGESSELQYSLLDSTTLLDVEASTGQIYILDASSVGDGSFIFQINATDKHGLSTTTKVQIKVNQNAHDDSVTVISLNQPLYIVEKMIPEMEDSTHSRSHWSPSTIPNCRSSAYSRSHWSPLPHFPTAAAVTTPAPPSFSHCRSSTHSRSRWSPSTFPNCRSSVHSRSRWNPLPHFSTATAVSDPAGAPPLSPRRRITISTAGHLLTFPHCRSSSRSHCSPSTCPICRSSALSRSRWSPLPHFPTAAAAPAGAPPLSTTATAEPTPAPAGAPSFSSHYHSSSHSRRSLFYILPQQYPSMENVLGWTVKILSVRAEDGTISVKTYINFIAMDSSGAVIAATEVQKKLHTENEALASELENVFGPGLEIKVEDSSGNSKVFPQEAIITLGVLLAKYCGCFSTGILLFQKLRIHRACLHVHSVQSAIGSTQINCAAGSNINVGSELEGYEGDVEIITNIRPEDRLVLEAYLFPIGLEFVELVYTDGDSTATVRTKKPLDADELKEHGEQLFYSVTCSNTGLKNIRTVDVQDVNDNPPIFQSKTYSGTVSETTEVGSTVLRVSAVDADVSVDNNRITYSILPPVPDDFEVRDDGNIRLKKRLNFNNAQLYTFTVEAKDIGQLNDTSTITITVSDYDNLNPYFDHSLYKATIEENQAGPLSDVTPASIKAQDGDTGINEPVVYSITAVFPNEYQSSFVIDGSSGVISVTTGLDREENDQITVNIQATQQDDASKTANAVVSVTVKDVDDNPPKFDQDVYTVSIPENSPQDQFVLQTRVTDLDLGGFMGTLQIIPDTVPFSIGPDGTILVKSSVDLDRETTDTFSFQVEAQENPPSTNTATAEVTIVLLDENDNSPQFTTSKYEGKVFSNQTIGMPVVKVEATDLDEGPNGEISYFIEFGNDDGFFAINENDGEITLVKTIPLLENEIIEFALYVTAKDGGDISRSTAALVNVKAPGESHPQFLHKTYQGQVEEDQENAQIIKIDFLSLEPMVPVTLAVESETDKFSIDTDTGVLSTKVKLDFEEKSSYTVQVSITDGTNRDEASVEVEVLDINDNSPVFEIHPATVPLPENYTVGDDVTNVTATDADSGFNGEVRYTLLGGVGRFSVNQETGVITLDAPLDRETQDQYRLVITAQDQGRPSRSVTTTLDIFVTDINDNFPIFSKQQYEATVSEHAEVAANVVNIMARDEDDGENAVVTYHIVKQEPPSTSPVFTIDADSGSISLAEKLDYGKVKQYTLEVEGQDGGDPVLTGSVSVTVWVEDINDKAPAFSKDQYDVSVYENLAGGNALVSLEISDEDEAGFSKGHFIMDNDTFIINSQGVISLRSDATLDRETRDKYNIEVIAVDQPVDGLSSTAQVIINVLDVNDNNPQFLPLPEPIVIQEGVYTPSSPGEVCLISATDSDIEENGRVTMIVSSYSNIFSFKEDGTLLAINELDRETQDVYDVVIVAVDNGIPQGNNITTVRINITDINDNAPVFSSNSYSKSILVKDAKVGEVLLTLSATDKDVGSNAIISYSFSEVSSMVALDAETGDITLTSDLSEVTEDTMLNLTAIATDHGTPAQSDEAEVLIYFKIAALSESVAFENSSYNFIIKENEPEATIVGKVKALTGSPQVTVSYNMKSHEDVFSVDSEGTIKALKSLDKEKEGLYFLTVEAVDSRTPPNTAETMISVQVENVNEAPVFVAEKYKGEIFSVTPYKFPILKVQASDPDVGENSELQYSLETSSTLLDVEASTGQIYVLDASSVGDGQFTLQVKATDKHGLAATTTVEIIVKESVNDNVVVISLNQPVLTVEKKIPDIEDSMKKVLSLTVEILSVSTDSGIVTRTILRASTAKTYMSFIAIDTSGAVIQATEVKEKLQSNHNDLEAELQKVFGPDLEFQVEEGSGNNSNDSSQAIVIALSAVIAISIVGFIVLLTVYLVKVKKIKRGLDPDRESFNISKHKKSSIDNAFNFHNKEEDKEVDFSSRRESERYVEHDTDLRNGSITSAL